MNDQGGALAFHYDTIIVGAGSAGATLAARLTEDSERSVLLLTSTFVVGTVGFEPTTSAS